MKYGLRPAKKAKALQFSQIRAAEYKAPPHPQFTDRFAVLDNWQMLGNDNFGDCVAVGCNNLVRVITRFLTNEVYYDINEVFRFYRTQNPGFTGDPRNPGQDEGMEIQTALEEWRRNSYFGHKVVAFAAVDPFNADEVNAAIAIFGGLLPGYRVTRANEKQFAAGKPWEYVPGSPVVARHLVLVGDYKNNPANDRQFVTWAKETGFTDLCWRKQIDELWVVILEEHFGTKQFIEGIDLEKLKQYYAEVTNGKVLPIPTPQPPTDTGWMPGAVKISIPATNYQKDRAGRSVKAVVQHIAAGSLAGMDSWFANSTARVSAHFGVGKNGEIHQYVSVNDTAYAVGNVNKPTWADIVSGVNPNLYTVSIENEGQPADAWTESQVAANIKILQWIKARLGFRYALRRTLIGHSEINSVNRPNDPGPNCPWSRLETGGNGDDPTPIPPPSPDSDLVKFLNAIIAALQSVINSIRDFIERQ